MTYTTISGGATTNGSRYFTLSGNVQEYFCNVEKKTSFMNIKMIGAKIAKARKEMNLSQAELAQRLFISPQAVGKWERGESVADILPSTGLQKYWALT